MTAIPDRYRFATRLNSFRLAGGGPARSLGETLDLAASVPGLSAVELNYPQQIAAEGEDALRAALEHRGLALTALNLRFDDPVFRFGAVAAPDAVVRSAAVRLAQEAVEVAARHEARHVVVWLGQDGFDAPFQADHARLWADAVDAFRRVAGHDPSVRVSIEAKPSDPRRFALVRGTADAMLMVRDVGAPNLGVTLDFCHVLMAGEYPPASAVLALAAGKLFGVHLNDGHGRADDGLPVASVHPWETLELLALLRRHDYRGTIYFDTFPEREDPAAECAANIRTVRRFERALDRLDSAAWTVLQARHDALGAMRLFQDLLLGADGEA